MKDQRLLWEREHESPTTFTRMHTDRPSSPVVELFASLQKQKRKLKTLSVLDIGTGKGRNALYAGSFGCNVVGVDFSTRAISAAKKRVQDLGLANIHFQQLDLTKKWPFKDQSFDIIIDCNTTICIPNPGRKKAIGEAFRVLKVGGLYLFYGIATTPLVKKYPGPEVNSGIFPKSGKFEKQYTKEELVEMYKSFQLECLGEKPGRDIIEGNEVSYTTWKARFKKR